jgi:MoxR-like ATPase
MLMTYWKTCKFENNPLPTFPHLFDDLTRNALRAALGARRPLLVRGEPGIGKTQLAHAAAYCLKRPIVSRVITARTESTDLHYSFDAIARLGQAQILSVTARSNEKDVISCLDEKKFLRPGPLWWVFDWKGAEDHYQASIIKGPRPPPPGEEWKWEPSKGTVLLIDEIDKADPDLPNGLLESFGNGQFSVPYCDKNQVVKCKSEHEPPLVIVTTNEERELPAAFVRRCLVLTMVLPDGEDLVKLLIERGQAHFQNRIKPEVYKIAAEQLVKERTEAVNALVKPGQAEYLDILRAITEVADSNAKDLVEEQKSWLEKIKHFALRKDASLEI